MNSDLNNLFQKHHGNQLNESEKSDFDRRLSSDADFLKEYEEYAATRDIAALIHRREINDQVIKIYTTKVNSRFSIKRILPYIGVAACITILALFWYDQSNLANQSKNLFTPYPDKITVMGENSASISTAMGLYNHQAYVAAIQEFNQLNTAEAEFYKGLSYLAINDAKNASKVLKPFTQDKENFFYEASLWYISLALLQDNKANDAKHFLQALVNDKRLSYHKNEAMSLLTKIK